MDKIIENLIEKRKQGFLTREEFDEQLEFRFRQLRKK